MLHFLNFCFQWIFKKKKITCGYVTLQLITDCLHVWLGRGCSFSFFGVVLLFWMWFVVVGCLGFLFVRFGFYFFRTLEASLIQQKPLYIKAKENTSYQIKKVDMSKKSLRDKEKSCDKEKQNIKELEIELNDIEKAWRAFEKKAEEEILQRAAAIELGESQVN